MSPKGSRSRMADSEGCEVSQPANSTTPSPEGTATETMNVDLTNGPAILSNTVEEDHGAEKDRASHDKRKRLEDDDPSRDNLLFSIPPELLTLILDHVRKDMSSTAALGRTCKMFYSLLIPQLHHTVTAEQAPWGLPFSVFVRTFERFLSIAQHKQLRQERKYRDQLQEFGTAIDEHLKPSCTAFVKELVVAHTFFHIAKQHDIAYRYFEEAVKNLDNLESFKSTLITRSVASSLASLRNLKTLHLNFLAYEHAHVSSYENMVEMTTLGSIKNLEHIELEDNSDPSPFRRSLMALITNSASTLKRLKLMIAYLYDFDDLICYCLLDEEYAPYQYDDKDKEDASSATATYRKPFFEVLETFSIECIFMSTGNTDALMKGIDFLNLHELEILALGGHQTYFYRKMTALIDSSSCGKGTKLRKLCLSLSLPSLNRTINDINEVTDVVPAFIASFDNLESLEINNRQVASGCMVRRTPGLAAALLHAILNLKSLRTLRLGFCMAPSRPAKVDYLCLSAKVVGQIMEALPQLREFVFAPVEQEITEIAQALSRGTQLTSIHLYNRYSNDYKRAKTDNYEMLSTIVKGFLNSPRSSTKLQHFWAKHDLNEQSIENCPFIWESCFRLRTVGIYYSQWELSSSVSSRTKRSRGTGQLRSDDGNQKVWHRIVGKYHEIYDSLPDTVDTDGKNDENDGDELEDMKDVPFRWADDPKRDPSHYDSDYNSDYLDWLAEEDEMREESDQSDGPGGSD